MQLSRTRLRSGRPTRHRPPEAAGFTLVELVLAIGILGILMGAVCAAVFATARADVESTVRLDEARDVQFASIWFGNDVAGANAVTVGPGSGALCTVPVGSTVVVQFENDDIAVPPGAPPPAAAPYGLTPAQAFKTVYYWLPPAGTVPAALHRLTCVGSPATTTDITVARTLAAAAPGAPTTTATSVSLTITSLKTAQTFTLQGIRRPA